MLVHLVSEDSPSFDDARAALRLLIERGEEWAVCDFVCAEFLRVATHPRVLTTPLDLESALGVVDDVLACPGAVLCGSGRHHAEVLANVALDAGARGNDLYDCHIAALCAQNGIRQILTDDRGFRRHRAVTAITLADFVTASD